jgi:hypothetical protein
MALGFDELLQSLPIVKDPPPITPAEDVRYVEEEHRSFVPPRFDVQRPIRLGETSVVLVSAPAAVGKTTVAKEIARRTGAPLWNLSSFQVGSHTYLGTLGATLGMVEAGHIVQRLADGDFLLVLDALDEAELRAGTSNFEAFLGDLTRASQEPRAKPSLVLLARGETSDLISIVFDLDDVPFAHFDIDFFDEEQAHLFIDRWLDEGFARADKSPAHRTHPEPFALARQLLFERVFDVFHVDSPRSGWQKESIRTFVGYAPVLKAMAAYLEYENYQELINDLRVTGPTRLEDGAESLWRFLLDIVAKILQREQAKVTGSIRAHLEHAAAGTIWNSWDEMYAPPEQCARVLASTVPGASAPSMPPGLPKELRAPYEEALQPWVAQHPFRGVHHGRFSNVVFAEYLYAWALTAGPPDERDAVRARMLEPDYLPSALLGRFMLVLPSQGDDPHVDSMDFGFVYESLREEARRPDDVSLALTEVDELRAWISFADRQFPDVSFKIAGEQDRKSVRFLRRLSNAVVSVSRPVILGTDGGTFVLGPDVDLQCDSVQVAANSVRIQLGQHEEDDPPLDVRLEAAHYDSSIGPPRLSVYGNGRLGVRWDPTVYPWVPYALEDEQPREDDRELIEPARYLMRLLKWFRGGGFGGLSSPRKLIDNPAVTGDAPLATDLRHFMLARDIIKIDGGLYRLDLAKMQELGISWVDVRARVMSEGSRRFLREFLSLR